MTCQKLTVAPDHKAFQQRIRREVGSVEEFVTKQETQNRKSQSEFKNYPHLHSQNYWVKATANTLVKNQNPVKDEYVHQPRVLTYVRLNQGVQGIKDLKSKLIDSTYINASDPNSMRDLGMTRNAEYTWAIGQHPNQQKGLSYSKYMVPKGKPTNNTFYSFGGRSSILQVRENEVVSPVLLSNSKHLQTNTLHPVREFSVPQVQQVADYSKNISHNIFSPGTAVKDFKSAIPETVKEQDRLRRRNRSANVRMHTYRGTTVGYQSYDPPGPFEVYQPDKIERIKKIRSELKSQIQMRKQAERDLAMLKTTISQISKKIPKK